MPLPTSTVATRKYKAFISYRHADNQSEGRRWAAWLHESLEGYEIPRRLVGQAGRGGTPIPESLFPVFRDEAELPAESDLSTAIRRALEASEFLIVICSPRAAASPHVCREIEVFKELGKGDRILALMIAGEPSVSGTSPQDAPTECFPRPLRWGVVGPDGVVDWTRSAEPISADVRPGGLAEEGFTTAAAYRTSLLEQGVRDPATLKPLVQGYARRLEQARLKIVAGLLGVELGTLTRHDNRHRIARLRQALTVVGGLLLLVLVAAGIAVVKQLEAGQERDAANHANSTANGLINDMLYSLGERLAPLGQVGLLEQVSESSEKYFVNLPPSRLDRTARLDRGAMWISRARVLDAAKNATAARAAIGQALRELEALQNEGGETDRAVLRQLSLACEQYADLYEELDPDGAIGAATRAHSLNLQLRQRFPDDDELRRDAGQIAERLGDLFEDNRADMGSALRWFQESFNDRERLTQRQPDDPRFQRDLAVSCGRLGDTFAKMGRPDEAEATYRRGIGIRTALIAAHSLNTQWQSELGRSHQSLGEFLIARHRLPEAVDSLNNALEVRQLLANFDPHNGRWSSDLLRTHAYLAWAAFLAEDSRAEVYAENGLRLSRKLTTAPKVDEKVWLESARLHEILAELRLARGDAAAADLAACEAAQLLQGLSAGKRNLRLTEFFARLEKIRGEADALRGDHQAAFEHFRESWRIFAELTSKDSRNVEFAEFRARVETLGAISLSKISSPAEPPTKWQSMSLGSFQALDEAHQLSPRGQEWFAAARRLELPQQPGLEQLERDQPVPANPVPGKPVEGNTEKPHPAP
jgi:tetratricopeptide (TPR) repeat protein